MFNKRNNEFEYDRGSETTVFFKYLLTNNLANYKTFPYIYIYISSDLFNKTFRKSKILRSCTDKLS